MIPYLIIAALLVGFAIGRRERERDESLEWYSARHWETMYRAEVDEKLARGEDCAYCGMAATPVCLETVNGRICGGPIERDGVCQACWIANDYANDCAADEGSATAPTDVDGKKV